MQFPKNFFEDLNKAKVENDFNKLRELLNQKAKIEKEYKQKNKGKKKNEKV